MLTLEAGKQAVTRLAISADGAWLAVAGEGREVHFWNLLGAPPGAKTFQTPNGSVAWLGFLPDNRIFVLETYGRYALHDPATGDTATAALDTERWVGRIVAPPDRSAFYGTGNEAQRWDFDGNKLTEVWNFRVPDTKTDTVTGRGGLVLPPNGTVIAAVSNGRNKTWLHTRDRATGALRGKRLVADATIRDLTLFPDGQTLAFVRTDGGKAAPNAVVVGGIGKRFRAVVTAKAREPQFTALELHPSGTRAAVGQSDGVVRTFDTDTWTELTAHQWDKKPVSCVRFAPDGLKAAAAFDGANRVVLWDVDL